MPRGRGSYPSEMEEVLRKQVNALRADNAELRTRLNDLVTKYNAHAHAALGGATDAGSQASTAAAPTATEDVTRF